ncbi:hypothetical protein M514_20459 [Trichuris suis]|uniref:Uncharacterized protein n=1 Tax=Trichuris suis TaxID=68888 RepID=A0A085ND77_9BILA|nr:hypothetical protein M514_20459 [Trichuris suis]
MLDDRGGFDRLGHDLLWLLPLWASSSFGARPRRCLWLLESANGLFVSSDVGHVSFISIKCSRKVSSFPTVVMAKMSSTYRLKKMGASEVLMLPLRTGQAWDKKSLKRLNDHTTTTTQKKLNTEHAINDTHDVNGTIRTAARHLRVGMLNVSAWEHLRQPGEQQSTE